MANPTISERLDMVAALDPETYYLAFDGCHKIYVGKRGVDEGDMFAEGYGVSDFHPVKCIRPLWEMSCGLVFMSPWDLKFDRIAWPIEQCEED